MFFNRVLYKSTSRDTDLNGFNRHLVIHLLKNDFNEPANFARLFLALTQITFIESLHNQNVPFFWQGVDGNDLKVSQYINELTSQHFLKRRIRLKELRVCDY